MKKLVARVVPSLALAGLAFAVGLPAPSAAADDAAPRAGRAVRRTPIVDAVEKAAPAVVSVGTTQIVKVRYWDWDFLQPGMRDQEQHGLGSGVIVHPSGYVVTNAHVINQASKILVKLTGDREGEPEIPATLIAADLEHDLALLRLEKPGPYPTVEFGRSDDLMIGETVIAMGNPFGIGRTVTAGIISALDRTINVREASFRGLIQTDAAVNRGNSGGPLVNIQGEWIGVNSAIYSLSGGADGISFAIPVDVVRKFIVDSLRGARFGDSWLGMRFGAEKDGRLVVERVHPLGPAARAGVPVGARLPRTVDPLRFCFDLVDAARTGAFRFEVDRGRDGARSVELAFERIPTDDLVWRELGLRVAEVDEARSETTGWRVGAGLFVTEVRSGGPAERVGIERGDLLVMLGRRRLTAREDVLDVLLPAAAGDTQDVDLRRTVRLVDPRGVERGARVDELQARIVLD
jgi:serine protease Do